MQPSPIERSADVLGGAVVFTGTRGPVQTLLDYCEAGDRLDDFLRDVPTVSREQAVAALELAGRARSASMRVLLDECLSPGLAGKSELRVELTDHFLADVGEKRRAFGEASARWATLNGAAEQVGVSLPANGGGSR